MTVGILFSHFYIIYVSSYSYMENPGSKGYQLWENKTVIYSTYHILYTMIAELQNKCHQQYDLQT